MATNRYVVCDMKTTHRSTKSRTNDRVIAVVRMKPWVQPEGMSDNTGEKNDDYV